MKLDFTEQPKPRNMPNKAVFNIVGFSTSLKLYRIHKRANAITSPSEVIADVVRESVPESPTVNAQKNAIFGLMYLLAILNEVITITIPARTGITLEA